MSLALFRRVVQSSAAMNSHTSSPFDTIAAIATATGGGVGILRVSGPAALEIGRRCFRTRSQSEADFTRHPRLARFGSFIDPESPDEPLDDGLALAFHGPHSFTGEDVVELHLHGGTLHLARCLAVLLRQGARLADPGEFTRRAFLAGKLDLTQAEAIADLVSAQTDLALKQARTQLQGSLSREIEGHREALLHLRAHLEVNLDFSEEDIPLIDPLGLAEKGRTLGLALGHLAETFVKGRRLREGARVVLAGPPNAGKSSLFNALAGEDRAIVTAIPGTTRDTLEESLDIRGIPVVLVDTAGLRETDDLVERLGVERTHRAVRGADLVLRLVGPEDPDVETELEGELVVHSKIDLRRDRPEGLAISTLTGEGLEALKEEIAERLGLIPREGLVIVRERQYEALKVASDACLRAADGLSEGLSPELPAVDLQDAMEALDRLVGKTTIEDMLDRLFSTFCIGK